MAIGESEEDIPLLTAKSDEPLLPCGTTEKDGVVTSCPVCAAGTYEADGEETTDDVNNNSNNNAWTKLPEMFSGQKGMAYVLNIPAVPVIDLEDTRLVNDHLGNGSCSVITEIHFGTLHWIKIMTGGYPFVGASDGSPSFLEPKSCRYI